MRRERQSVPAVVDRPMWVAKAEWKIEDHGSRQRGALSQAVGEASGGSAQGI